MALTDKLSAIGNAIREKTGKEELLTLDQMPGEIASITTGGGGGEVEPIVLSGDQYYGCVGPIAGAYIEKYGNTISTQGITGAEAMFRKTTATKIPFDLNFTLGSMYATYTHFGYIFQDARQLKELPKIKNVTPKALGSWCQGCYSLKEIPEDYFDTWDWSHIENNTNMYANNMSYMFYNCYSLRKAPLESLRHANQKEDYSYSVYKDTFNCCYSLDELVNAPIPYDERCEWIGNGLNGFVSDCYRLKNLTFETPNGQPVILKWVGVSLDLTHVGYFFYNYIDKILNYNSGITADKEVKDDTTYQALKNDPDWWTRYKEYSRYNHDSAVATINSLPDTSAFVAAKGLGNNIIKFTGLAGSKTDGGAINTLTEEEIAVAAAKGWTVTLS